MLRKMLLCGLGTLISGLIPCFAQSRVSLLGYAVYATGTGCETIEISDGGYIDSFDSSKGSYNLTKQDSGGNVFASGNVELSESAIIHGSIHVLNTTIGRCEEDNNPGISLSHNSTATEGYLRISSPLFAPSPATITPGTQDYHFKSNATLSPGSYRNIVLGGDTKVTLLPGAYNVNSITLRDDSILTVDPPGQVIISVAGQNVDEPLDFRGGSISNPSLIPKNFQLIYGGAGDLELSGGSMSYATVYAPNAEVELSSHSDWYGAMVVRTLDVEDGSAIHYDRSLALLTPTRSINFPKAVPDALFTNEPATVTVTAQVGADPNLLPETVELVQLNAQARAIGLLGRLYDDGTHGDRLRGDGTFTRELSLNQSSEKTMYLAVTATYRDSLVPAASRIFVISVHRRPSDTEVQATSQIQRRAYQFLQTARTQMGDGNARHALVSFLLQQTGVSNAGISSDGLTVWVKYSSGIMGVILGNPSGTKGGGGRLKSTEHALESFEPQICNLLGYAPPGQLAISQDPIQFPGTGRAVVLAPFFDKFSPNDESEIVASDLSKICGVGKIVPIKNDAVTVRTMANLNQYGVIHISTHGAVIGGITGRICRFVGSSPQDLVVIGTRESDVDMPLWLPDALTCGVVSMMTPDGLSVLGITAPFIEKYAGGGFPGSIVFADACQSEGTDNATNLTLSSAFLANGASAYFGWRNSVTTVFAFSTAQAVYQVLTNLSLSPDQRTPKMAYMNLTMTVDPATLPEGTHGTLELDLTHNSALSGNLIVNGGFETGDFSGWTAGFTKGGIPTFPYNGPDGPYVSVVSEQRAEGNYAARLGRWDEPYMGGGQLDGPPQPGAEPGGTDWMYQDAELPNLAKLTLEFSYDVVTFDATIYDYFYVEVLDSDTGNLLATVLPHTGPNPGPDYGFFATTGWQHVSFDLTPFAGRRVRLWFGNHQDGFGDQTAVYIDGVAVLCPAL